MHLLQSGVDLTVIKNWLGHVNLDTTHALDSRINIPPPLVGGGAELFVDFYCSNLKLVIEIDGESHKGRFSYDMQRQQFGGTQPPFLRGNYSPIWRKSQKLSPSLAKRGKGRFYKNMLLIASSYFSIDTERRNWTELYHTGVIDKREYYRNRFNLF